MVRPAPTLGLCAVFFIAGAHSAPALAERCSTPSKPLLCGQTPLTYECPPCAPTGVGFALPGKLEEFRRALEAYREDAEEKRTMHPDGPRSSYEKAIEKYREGISAYKDAVASTSRDPE